MINDEISDVCNLLANILKSAIMFLVGMCSSWIASTLYDQSMIVMIILWIVCEMISSIIVRPMANIVLKDKHTKECGENRRIVNMK